MKKTRNSRRIRASVLTSKLHTCFVLMPFGQPFDHYYKTIFAAAVRSAGLRPHRADDLSRPSAILHDIWNYTDGARLLLADLTGQYANVFYEIGLAHALAKPVIMVTQSMRDVPFDLRQLRVLQYNKQLPDWGSRLRRSITAAIKEVLASPIDAIIPPFVDAKARLARAQLTAGQAELVHLLKEDGFAAAAARGLHGPRFPYMQELGPGAQVGEAYGRVAHYLSLGVPKRRLIPFMIAEHGFNEAWVRKAVEEVAKKLKSRQHE